MYCKSCGEQVNENQAICLKCGVKVGQGSAFCANCGKPVAKEAAVCLNCGVAINGNSAENVGGYNKALVAAVCFFLGEFGVHNFMFGEVKKGIFKIAATLCFGLGFIFSLIDFVKIISGKYVIDSTKLI